MKAYVHNPEIFRQHFKHQVGSGGFFRGKRMHRGDGLGLLLGKLARSAIPLLKAGVKAVTPHAKRAAKAAFKEVAPHLKKAGEDAVQSLAAKAVQKFQQPTTMNKKRKQRKHRVRRKIKRQGRTTFDALS